MRAALTILLLLQPSLAKAEPRRPFAEILATHNRLRAEHALPPLMWSEALAASASAYAAVLARTNSFQHDATPGRRKREGENLWMGPRGVYGPATMTAGFVREGRLFRPGIYPDVSASGNWLDVAHYTQIIWPTTTAVGCGLVSNKWSDFLVCRYSPPGNKDGRMVR